MASGISGIESVVVVGDKPSKAGALRDFSASATVFYCADNGEISTL
jgi:hypothetical protein